MSAETFGWLNTQTLIGCTDKRGTAWHYREEMQGDESNHYPGFIPIEDVRRRLFYWKPVEGHILVQFEGPDGNTYTVPVEEYKAILRAEKYTDPNGSVGYDGTVFGIHGDGYKIHEYDEWLLHGMGNILDTDELGIGSAGLLRNGAWAWVQVEMPDTIENKHGFDVRPFITGSTSLDGSSASLFTKGFQATVCDNTLKLNWQSALNTYKAKHTSGSLTKLQNVREALDLIWASVDDFNVELDRLCELTVTDKQWSDFLTVYVPFPEDNDKKNKGVTFAEVKRAKFKNLWNSDPRVAPWKNTAFGVVQAANTYTHHYSIVRGSNRAVRNAEKALNGSIEKMEKDVLAKLELVMS